MINLDTDTKSLEIDLAGAVTTSELVISTHAVNILDSDTSVTEIINTNILTNGTTAVTAMAAPAAGDSRVVKSLTVFNADTVSAVVSVQINDGSSLFILVQPTLGPGETLMYSAED